MLMFNIPIWNHLFLTASRDSNHVTIDCYVEALMYESVRECKIDGNRR